jgi:hypothetical protein
VVHLILGQFGYGVSVKDQRAREYVPLTIYTREKFAAGQLNGVASSVAKVTPASIDVATTFALLTLRAANSPCCAIGVT